MNFLNFSEANCKNCYKCLRYCPVKAIQIKDEQAIIINERCIGCGQCMKICPQEARSIKSDLIEVKEAIRAGRKVVVSIAPSFSGAFDVDDPFKIIAGIRKLGFNIIEETASGADVVTELYRRYLEENQPTNIITTSCPSSNYLVEKYYPELIEYNLPIVSPMIAHGKILKKNYGRDSFTVFIGPCIAKKIEGSNLQHKGSIDAVLTFEEISEWLEHTKIDINSLEPSKLDNFSSEGGASYPIKGGVIEGLLQGELKERYSLITVDGIYNCIELFESLKNETLEGVCVEAHICKGSCIGGSAMPKEQVDYYKRRVRVGKYISNRKPEESIKEVDIPEDMNFKMNFFDKSIKHKDILEEDIENILKSMGKYTKDDQLNCGACGYDSCRNKAVAVIEGMAEMNMCLPYMRSKAESLKNIIFENSPNGIILLDEDLNVKEFNPSAERIFNIESDFIRDKPIAIIIDEEIFDNVKKTRESILGKRVYYKEYDKVLIQNVLYLKDQNIILTIMIDVTIEESNKKELNRVKEQTIDAAQSVIEKQMRVAQEIASLLGETTAETKMILTKLKNISNGEIGDL